ncbi:interleukin-18-like isoform X3 [Heptranchias perlo]|uniref:interleukin-18-like isoform X3 n=1 Tax=Heptranchias perlo TaxID=212740 RepID=UPI00355A1174
MKETFRFDSAKIFSEMSNQFLELHFVEFSNGIPYFEDLSDDDMKTDYFKRRQFKKPGMLGVPVVFQIKVAGSVYHMYCTDEENRKVVKFKEGSAPTNVEENMKNIIFYQQYFDGTHSKFESAWASGWFLCTMETNMLHMFALKKPIREDEMIAVGLDDVP